MKGYSQAILTAVLIFPLIALLITLPYMIKQYRKYGAIPFLRSLIVYSFILYLLCAYFTVILPLPSIASVEKLTTPWVQLKPFTFVNDIISAAGIKLNDFSTYLNALTKPAMYINLFNLLLTLPFGIYLRYYFNRKWWEVALLSFLLSLFFEATQLTGLYGVYPRPYRLFDVDDLILNTAGGIMGYMVTPLFSFMLPSRKKLDELSFEKGKRVSFLRRTIAYLLDYFLFTFTLGIITPLFNIKLDMNIIPFLFLLYFIISTTLFKGQTFGKRIVRIKIANVDGKNAKLYQILLRYILRYLIYYGTYYIAWWYKSQFKAERFTSLICAILIFISVIIYIKSFIDILKKRNLLYEKISKTKNISTIIIKDKKEKVEAKKIENLDNNTKDNEEPIEKE